MPPTLRGFEFHRRLGEGAFGEVWLATDQNLRTPRAIKVLRPDRCTDARRAVLRNEARRMASLPRHPNRVQVHVLLEESDNLFLVMEYVPGGALSAMTSPQRPLPWERAVRYTAAVGAALADLHERGMMHRDVKPANILWDPASDEVLLGDYGIAAVLGDTRLAGTSGYIAPELVDGEASPKIDVFSLAAALYHLVAGSPPFDTRDLAIGLAQASLGLGRPVPALQGVPPLVEDVILAGLTPDPHKRPTLAVFTSRLRGAHLQGLADRLMAQARKAGCSVRLRIDDSSARPDEMIFRPIVCRSPQTTTRDMSLVPEEPPTAMTCTGDLLRLETTADTDGYLTVLNLGSSGALTVLFPNPQAPDNRARAGVAQRLTVRLTPPAGTDRAAVIWTRQPGGLTPTAWQHRLEGSPPSLTTLDDAVATRGMEFVLHEAEVHPGEDWTAQVIAITHA
jgi:serine/threonine protein kinase